MLRHILTTTLLLPLAVLAQVTPVSPHCDQFVPFGYPTAQAKDTTELCRISYYTLHDNERKVPILSAEYLLPENVGGDVPRKNMFKADPNLPVGKRAELEDYDSAGYDRGHMAPANNMRSSTAAMAQSFYLSNMVPQAPSNNRGVWRELESSVIKRVKQGERLHVLTGPIFDDEPPLTIGKNQVAVPTAIFKVIINISTSKGEAYIIPNVNASYGPIEWYKVPISIVEARAKVNLLPKLSKALISLKD